MSDSVIAVSIVMPGGYVVVRKFWVSKSRSWIGTIVANWRAWTFGFEIINRGLVVVCGPLLFAIAATGKRST